MIQINQLKLPFNHSAVDLEQKIRKTLKLHKDQSFTYKIAKKSFMWLHTKNIPAEPF